MIEDQIFKIFKKQIQDIEIRQIGLQLSGKTEILRSMSYGIDEKEIHSYDYFYSKKCENPQKLPFVVDVHGGAFCTGDKKYNQYYGDVLSNMGYQVAIMNYELVPEVNLKKQVQQVSAAINFIIKEYPNSADFYLTADSSGSYVVNLLCCIWGSEEASKIFEVEKPERKIKALGLTGAPGTSQIFPPFMKPFGMKMDNLLLYQCKEIKDYLNLKCIWNDNVPPIFLMSSEDDMYYNNCRRQEKWLMERNHPVKSFYCTRKENGKTFHCFNVIRPDLSSSQKMNAAMDRYFKSL